MNKIQLTKGNELDNNMHHVDRCIESLKEMILEAQLVKNNCFSGDDLLVKINRTELNIDRKRIVEFLNKELSLLESRLEVLEFEFKQL